MPDSDDQSSNSPANLPVPVTPDEPQGTRERWLIRAMRSLFGWKPGSMRANLEVILDASTPGDAGISIGERTMLRNILALRERRISDLMVPRPDIIAVRLDISLGDLIRTFESAGHSRLVVYDETLDNPQGMVHIRDLIGYMTVRASVDATTNAKRKKPFPADLDLRAVDLAKTLDDARIVRKLLYVPPSMPAIDLLAKMQAMRIHLALVVDEYGGSDGLVSIEDIVEEVVGEIDDEHDSEEAPQVVKQPDGSFIADARASLEDVASVVGPDFAPGEEASEVDTLGGYLVSLAQRLPLRGEVIAGPASYDIEVLDADPRRVKKLRIAKRKQAPQRTRRKDAAPEANADAAKSGATSENPAERS
jgi:CBS domain containing-hemolysin-like protein